MGNSADFVEMGRILFWRLVLHESNEAKVNIIRNDMSHQWNAISI
jgi:hypothetical protein